MLQLSPGVRVGRYEITSRLGGGGMGEVFLARDSMLARDVALKVLGARAAAAADAAHALTREARSASALNHPNIVSVFDVGECDAGPFLVMELVSGETLRAAIARGLDLQTTIDIGRQIANALATAHAAGIVHRDIKPENVMIRGDGYVKVLDFGLARLAPSSSSATDAVTVDAAGLQGPVVEGTVAYMAPERLRGEAVTPASDVFALGAVLYEMSTHRHPFAAMTQVETIARLVSETPPPPSQASAAVPPAIDGLILRMLDKDPNARPAASEVEAALRAAATLGTAIVAPAAALKTVGRDGVLAELASAFEEVVDGRGHVIAIGGEPGIGKTTVAEAFIAAVTATRPCLVARGRSSEADAAIAAYLPWLEAIESIRQHRTDAMSALLKTYAPTWHAQVAPLTTGDTPDNRAIEVNRAGSQQWLKRELASFLEAVSRQTPLVLFLDDVQWADESSIDLLGHLADRLRGTRVLIIVTYRPAELQRTRHPFLRLKLEMESRRICHDLAISFLSEADVAQYLALEFPRHRFPPALTSIVHAKTEGNPLFMVDLLRSLRTRQVIGREDGAWALTRPLAELEREIPASIRSMIELKLAELDDGDRRLLVAASVQGPQFDSAILARALAQDQADIEDRLDALSRQHALVAQVREIELPDHALSVQYRFVHVLYHNALHASLGPSRRATLSAAIADALFRVYGAQPSHASELAALYEAARDFSRSAELFLLASSHARQVFADREALTLARRGIEMLRAMPDTPERRAREVIHLMSVALPMHTVKGYAAPELEETYQRARRLCDELGEHPQRFGVVCGVAAFDFMRAALRQAEATTEQVVRLAEKTGDPLMLIWAAWAYGSNEGHLGERLPEALERLDAAARMYDRSMHPAFMLMTGFDAGVGCRFQAARITWMLGDADAALRRSQAAVALARELQHPLIIGFALFFDTWIRQHRREADAALATARETLALVDAYGYPHLSAWTRVLEGWAIGATGAAAEGEAVIRRALADLEPLGIELVRPNFLALLAETEAAQGRFDEALATLAEAHAVAERTEERCYLAEIMRLEGELLVRRDGAAGVERARPILEAAIALASRQRAAGFESAAKATLAEYCPQPPRQSKTVDRSL